MRLRPPGHRSGRDRGLGADRSAAPPDPWATGALPRRARGRRVLGGGHVRGLDGDLSDRPLYERDPEAWHRHLAEGNAMQSRKRVAVEVVVRDEADRILVVRPN